MAYYRQEPFGEQLQDLRFARLLALIFNANSKKNKSPEDFMPDYGQSDRDMTADEQMDAFRAFGNLFGGSEG